MKKLISVIVPVYMNEGSLKQTYKNLLEVLTGFKSKYTYEILFINDGSSDNSLKELIEINKVDKDVKVINFTKNFGQLAAMQAGFEHSRGDILINISADMQDPTSLIADMVNKWEEGYKVVLCVRQGREDNVFAKITSKLFYNVVSASLPTIPKNGFDYFLLDSVVYRQMAHFNERNYFIQGNILWTGYEPAIIEYKRKKRIAGKSQWTLGKKSKYFIDGFISVSYLPIRLMSLLGIIFSLLGFGYAITIFFLWAFRETPFQGYAPIMIVLLISSGLIMIMLGIMGEYVWRTYDEVRNRPRYIIKNIIE